MSHGPHTQLAIFVYCSLEHVCGIVVHVPCLVCQHCCLVIHQSHGIWVQVELLEESAEVYFILGVAVGTATAAAHSGRPLRLWDHRLLRIVRLLRGRTGLFSGCWACICLFLCGRWQNLTGLFLGQSWQDYTSLFLGGSTCFIPRPIISQIQ